MRFLLAVLFILFPGSASALNLNARLTASLYSWERQPTGSTSIVHNTIHQLLSLKIQNVGVKGFSFDAYGRGYIHTEGSNPRTRLALYSTDTGKLAASLEGGDIKDRRTDCQPGRNNGPKRKEQLI